MHSQHTAARHAAAGDLDAYFRDGCLPVYGHATNVAALLLERLPSGEHEWLRPPDDDVRYVLTDKGRRDLAMARLFDPAPSVAEVLTGQLTCSWSLFFGAPPLAGMAPLLYRAPARAIRSPAHVSMRLRHQWLQRAM